MSNLCKYTNVFKRALLTLAILLSIVIVCNTDAMAVEPSQAEATSAQVQASSKANTEQKSDVLPEKSEKLKNSGNISQNPADKPLFGKKSPGKPLHTVDDTSTSDKLRQMLAMIVVITILGGICWVVCKKFMPRLKGPAGVKGRAVKILETTYIAPRQPVHLLQVGGKKLLIAGGRDGLKMLADVTDDFSSVLDEQDTAAEVKA